jgi:hypothetical protein
MYIYYVHMILECHAASYPPRRDLSSFGLDIISIILRTDKSSLYLMISHLDNNTTTTNNIAVM